jgi:hypothetical protein
MIFGLFFVSCLLVRHPSSKKDSRQAGMTDDYWNRVRYEWHPKEEAPTA